MVDRGFYVLLDREDGSFTVDSYASQKFDALATANLRMDQEQAVFIVVDAEKVDAYLNPARHGSG